MINDPLVCNLSKLPTSKVLWLHKPVFIQNVDQKGLLDYVCNLILIISSFFQNPVTANSNSALTQYWSSIVLQNLRKLENTCKL